MFDSQSEAPKSIVTMLVVIAAALAFLGGMTWYFTRP
jgi:hypothetical protein